MKQQVTVNFTNCKPSTCEVFEGIVNSLVDRGVEIPLAEDGFVEMLLLETEGTAAYSVMVYRTKKECVVDVTKQRQDDVANILIERRGLPEYKKDVIKL